MKLVAHCQNDRSFEEYVQREYLIYKMYQHITPISFNVRLCRITYVDENKPKQQNIHYGFLIESIKDVAKRNDLTVLKGNSEIRKHSIRMIWIPHFLRVVD